MTLPEFAEAQWLVPLDDMLKQAQQEYDVQDISPGARRLFMYKEKLYALPVYAEVTQLSSTAESWKIANGNYLPRTVAYRTMGDIIGVAVQEAIAGQKSPKDALDQAASETAGYLKKSRLYGTARSYTEP
jgi:ABC-type glycerol-3-phosphate transport system substrate-binding protein